jgi:hypothetical protein
MNILILVIVFLAGCMPYVQPYSQFYVPEGNIKTLKKVLLIGPELDVLGLADDSWLKDTKNVWQTEIIKKWTELKEKDGNLFNIVLPNKNHYTMLAELIAEQKLNELPLFNTKTGEKNKEVENRLRIAYGKLAQKAGVDAVMHVDFVIVPVEVKHNTAYWDGNAENVTSVSFGKIFFGLATQSGGAIQTKGTVPALSLSTQLINKDGKVLCESRGGYKVLTEITVGVLSDDRKTLSFKEALDEKYKGKRDLAIKLALSAMASPKKE